MNIRKLVFPALIISILAGCSRDEQGGFNCNCNTLPWNYSDNAVKLFLPTAFTPDGNGENDLFRLITPSTAQLSSYKLIVYNNSGVAMFSTTDPFTGWEGTDASGNVLPAGRFTYSIEFTTTSGNHLETCGCVHLFLGDPGNGCIYTNGIPYFFEDQFDPVTGGTPFVTQEIICN